MRITWTTRDSRSHAIRLSAADYGLCDLMGFHQFTLLFQCCFAAGGGPWMIASWMHRWFAILASELETQRSVLPYHYGADGDFGGGGTLVIRGEQWSLNVGPGECSLSQFAPAHSPATAGQHVPHRLTRWIDLRGQRQLETDGRIIRLSKKKQEYRWYAELPGLLQFYDGVPPEVEVRARAER
jgi:hypothetical protein